jgi:nucleoside-diphosphate-sugar epimerase
MRILLIGGTGFIGPHVLRLLTEAGHDVTLFHRGQTEIAYTAKVSHLHGDRDRLADFRGEFARLAPEVVVDMVPFTEAQARAVMDTFRGIARRVVALSSGDVYRAYGILRGTESGPPEPVPLAESAPLRSHLFQERGPTPRDPADPLRWVDDYEKILVERMALGDPELPGTVLRLPKVYGPGDTHGRLWPYLKRMDDGRPFLLLAEGLAGWRWTRGYVEDVAHAIVLAMLDDRAVGRVYNVGEPDALTEAEWVRAIGTAAGWRGRIVGVPPERLPEAVRRQQFAGLNYTQDLVTDTTCIRAELGYRETVPRPEALRRAVAWQRAHPPARFNSAEFDYAAENAVLGSAGDHFKETPDTGPSRTGNDT